MAVVDTSLAVASATRLEEQGLDSTPLITIHGRITLDSTPL